MRPTGEAVAVLMTLTSTSGVFYQLFDATGTATGTLIQVVKGYGNDPSVGVDKRRAIS